MNEPSKDKKQPAEGGGIDWDNVASEVATMLELNQGAAAAGSREQSAEEEG